MLDTVDAIEKVVDETIPEGQQAGSNMTSYYVSDTKHLDVRDGTIWVDTSEGSQSVCTAITVTDIPTAPKAGATYTIKAIITPAGAACRAYVKVNNTKNIKAKIIKNDNGTLYINIYPLRKSTGKVYVYCDSITNNTGNLSITTDNYMDITTVGFTNGKYYCTRAVKPDGTYLQLHKRTNGNFVYNVYGRDVQFIFKAEDNWPLVVEVDGVLENKTSELVHSEDNVYYQFTPTQDIRVSLLGADDERRTNPSAEGYIGYYSAEYVVVIDTI